ncbi:MAG TPA: acetamidase/formamidase family protein [Blastococcus sp.]|nr:acetamidase/formamidase family protein [Blastococcus sp.]
MATYVYRCADRGLPGNLHAIDHLTTFGCASEQACLLLGSAPIQGRLSGGVDIPDSRATVSIPTITVDVDVAPSAAGPVQIDPGRGAPRSAC